jgi:hypothetical protein
MEWLRVAGTGRSLDGATVTWSVAEGRRGRRWREVVTREGAVVHSLLLELSPDGRFSHLELTTAAGLLTLHPEGDGTIHGNAVTAAGVTHIRGLPWQPEDAILIETSVVSAVITAGWQSRLGLDDIDVVRVGPDLSLSRDRTTVPTASMDAHGLPVLANGHRWELEED